MADGRWLLADLNISCNLYVGHPPTTIFFTSAGKTKKHVLYLNY